MTDTAPEAGRARQRRRTRAAIVNATAELLAEGQTPGVNEIAEAADVSRRTIYQYFPTLDQLLLDATLGLLTQTDVDAAIEAASRTASKTASAAASAAASGAPSRAASGDASARVDAMVRALGEAAASSLPLGRSLIRLTVDTPPDDAPHPRRGYRRVAWIERALDPLRTELDDDLFERLVSGIAMVVGWEALIVLQDLRGLDPDDRTEASAWAARSLIQSTLEEQHRRT
ncbi:helix-turn-helix domain-containing protein [Kribbella sp. NPDC058693]|uniref:helix-turn-helix domain-containing protein n=1 Tax=Kribbella sp. NPDC058693 TaxID=3346602 RepID=UPI00365B86B5